MKLVACGINHKTAPLDLREKAYFSLEKMPVFLSTLVQKTPVQEAVLLSTCNRTEVYCIATEHTAVLSELAAQSEFTLSQLEPHSYVHYGENAVSHATRVASGLDSMVIGEPQILGQFKQAVDFAQTQGTCRQGLKGIFQHVFSAAKAVRTATRVGDKPLSFAHAVTFLTKRIFADAGRLNILLIGAGETIQQVAKYFFRQKAQQIWICNRSLSRARQWGESIQAQAISFSQMGHYLPLADVVVCATSSPIPVLGKGAVESALKVRKHRPILMVDLAVPRDIEAEVETLEDVYFYTLDHLKTIIADNFSDRLQAAQEGEKIVDIQTARFMRHLKSLQAVEVIKAFRAKMHEVSEQEVRWSLKRLQAGVPPEEVLSHMAKRLSNKFMHEPSVRLRQTSAQGKTELFVPMQQLFNLLDE